MRSPTLSCQWLPLALALALGCVGGIHAASSTSEPRAHKLKESIAAPRGWTKGARAPPDHGIELHIALPQGRFSELEQHLLEISDPSHSRYGQHLSKEEVEALVAPPAESVTVVDKWLAAHGIPEAARARSAAQDWVTVVVPVWLVEEMLATEYHVWKHDASGDALVRTTAYSLPAYLDGHVDLVQPSTSFLRSTAQASTIHGSRPVVPGPAAQGSDGQWIQINSAYEGRVNASCNETVTVTCLKQLYNIDYEPQAADKNGIAVTGYLEQYANENDFQLFFNDQVPAAHGKNVSFNTVLINGATNNQDPAQAGVEANLDTQFAFGLTYPTPGSFDSVNGTPPMLMWPGPGSQTSDTNEPYVDWLNFALNQTNLPSVISSSYGDAENSVPPSYAQRACNGFAALGARGVSVLVSSGDGGCGFDGPMPNEMCLNEQNNTEFIATFPASCPYVTAVGGTANVQEVAANFSGGGFSNYFSRPSYQKAAVQPYLEYLESSGVYKGLYNASGRGFPDVSAQSQNFQIYVAGVVNSVTGTSCSSPTFAAIVALLNDARLAAGKSTLGFLNPFLYSNGLTALHDITEGNAPGCGTQGYNATKGWDAITGLGTPDFSRLKELVLSF